MNKDKVYNDGYERGKKDAFLMKLNADGCHGCAFENEYSWKLPCSKCKRNMLDHWSEKR